MVVDAGDKAAEAGGVGARSEALEHGDGPRVDYGQRADDGQRAELPVLDAYGLSFDLHVLSVPPAFVLSQDQTLN